MKTKMENIKSKIERISYIRSEKDAIKYAFCIFDELEIDIQNLKNRALSQTPELWLLKVLLSIPFPFTIVLEPYHVDRVFRDCYYTYFSNQHFELQRFCKRLSFFKSEINEEMFFSVPGQKALQTRFLGSVVIKPHHEGAIGRTLLDPGIMLNQQPVSSTYSYLRLSKFTISVMGTPLSVYTFPYSMQDSETITCAEVTLLNILEYYANQYPDYRFLYPNDIYNIIKEQSPQRVLPTRGMNYIQVSTVLKQSRFSPRLYEDYSFNHGLSLKQLFHYYIESGIPVALQLNEQSNPRNIGHSVIGIGHSSTRKQISKARISCRNGISFIDTADLYDEYVIMDDNQLPFSVRKFDNLSIHTQESFYPSAIAVPLAKRMFMDASLAYSVAVAILSRILKLYSPLIDDKDKNLGSIDHPPIIRLFMTSARSYRKHKARSKEISVRTKAIYGRLPLPRFVWVLEIYSIESYRKKKVLGEIVLDATSSGKSRTDSAVLIQYKQFFTAKLPQQIREMEKNISHPFTIVDWVPMSGFSGNLNCYRNSYL